MNQKIIKLYDVTHNSPEITVTCNQNSCCPVCKTSCNNNALGGFFSTNKYYYLLYLQRICHECGEVVIEKYEVSPHLLNNNRAIDLRKRYMQQFPLEKELVTLPEQIETISPSFVKIFNEASTAEANHLLEICGMGYRKALEFLIKDYLIYKTPEMKDAISNERLAQSIARIDDIRIKTLASRSSWLGNDECHYVRKHEDYGINDLKAFIEAMLSYISYELTFEKALNMPHKP